MKLHNQQKILRLFQQSTRSIGYAHLSDMKREPYNLNKLPKLFSEIVTLDKDPFEQQILSLQNLEYPNPGQIAVDAANKVYDNQKEQANLEEIKEKYVENYKLSREIYQHLLNTYKEGDVTYIQIENEEQKRFSNAIFIGAQKFELKNLYKSLNLVKPDIVVLQLRPDQILENFKYDFKLEEESKYMKQITRSGYELYPNSVLVKYIHKELKKNGIILSKIPLGEKEDQYKEKVSIVKQYEDYSLQIGINNRLEPEIYATTALWAEQHKKPLVLGDLPMSQLKYNILNSYTLLEIERAFEKTVYRSYSDDITMYEAALIECPELFLSLSDDFMAGVVNKLSETYRNILVVSGFGQTRSIPHYLYYSKQANHTNSVSTQIQYKPTFETLVRKDNPETQIDKLVMIDHILNNNSKGIDNISMDLIKTKISKINVDPNTRYDAKSIQLNLNYQAKLITLYQTLIVKKYEEIKTMQKKQAAKDLEKRIKRLIRDDPNLIRELP